MIQTTPDAEAIARWIADVLKTRLRRKRAVVAVSGGVDSTVALYLAARAIGPGKVTGLFLPEAATSPETLEYVKLATAKTCTLKVVDVAPPLEAAGCYRQVNDLLDAIDKSWSMATHAFAVVIDAPFARRTGSLRYMLKVQRIGGGPDAGVLVPLKANHLVALVAANNLKQRVRMLMTYNEAERTRAAVIGTSNADELDFGFVVKFGDYSGDVQPLGNLSKGQVYSLAEQLGVPREIIDRAPTTDTFSLAQTQDEYYYALDPAEMRRLLDGGSPDDHEAAFELALRLRRAGELVALEPIRYHLDDAMRESS